MERFVEVAVALPLRHTLSYAVPQSFPNENLVGKRVLAPVGRRGVSGVIVDQTSEPPLDKRKLRGLSRLLEGPAVSDDVLSICKWVASYYDAPLGEVLKAAAPPGTSAAGTESLMITPAGSLALTSGALPNDLAAALAGFEAARGTLTAGRAKNIGAKQLAELEQRGWVRRTLDNVSPKMRTRTQRAVRRNGPIGDSVRDALKRAPKRMQVLEALPEDEPVLVTTLATQFPGVSLHLRNLQKAGLVTVDHIPVDEASRLHDEKGLSVDVTPPVLNQEQRAALDKILEHVERQSFHPYLLYGVTGSGKTEVYLQAIQNIMDKELGAIVLVPEISLTPQLAARFRARFGDSVAVLHSGLRPRERFIEWHRLSEGKARIALGARSAIFAPVQNLGMVVIDEEHDSSFKQEEGVRYHARTVALMRAKSAGAVCVLGSATPSVETFFASENGAATRLELPERANKSVMPEVSVVDMRRYQPDTDSFLTSLLATQLEETLARKEQAILFLNRRGFHTFVLCTACGDACRCSDCSVSLTYHRKDESLACHYCGHRKPMPKRCAGCGSDKISSKGIGTERVAEAVAKRFPSARVGRLDRDAGGGDNVAKLLGKMGRGEIDILIGTQMVSKGHDFPRVTLVGVLCADTGLSLPDFRAAEKTFQLLTQVSGRAGRGKVSGRVLIQSYRPEALAISCAAQHDYRGFYDAECEVRKELGYPPFGYLAALRVDGEQSGAVEQTTRSIAADLRGFLTGRTTVSVLGPSVAPLGRLRGRTRWHLWLRADSREDLRATLRFLRSRDSFTGDSKVRVSLDVDPISTL